MAAGIDGQNVAWRTRPVQGMTKQISVGRSGANAHDMIGIMAAKGDPIAKFMRWLDEARELKIVNYEAMALATADEDGHPSVRFVLLKGIDPRGFVFFTDARSRKGRELRANPRAALAFYWQPHGRQVRVEGRIAEVAPHEADKYWSTRPRRSQLAASASLQSARIRSRAFLLARVARLARKLRGCAVPRPPRWSGFRLDPEVIEFWTHREHRLHERELFVRRGNEWQRWLQQP
jgi:pyridoxamine 5'-phosphate oxidase